MECVTPIDVPFERTLYIGSMLSGILYGLDVFAFFASVYCISHRPTAYRKGKTFYVVYGGILLALITIDVALGALQSQYMWIDHRDHPGGPLMYFEVAEVAWFNILGMSARSVANILGLGLLMYRCYVIWGSRWYVIALSALICLASSVFVIMWVLDWALPFSSILNGTLRGGIPWISLSVGLNIVITSMICFRLLRMRALLRRELGPEMSRMYTNVAAMVVESAAPFSIVGIGLLVAVARNGDERLSYAFGHVWSIFFALSPQMIILRVAMGRGLLKETVKEINTMLLFAKPATNTAVDEECREVPTTIHEIPGTPADSSGTPVNGHTSTVSNAC